MSSTYSPPFPSLLFSISFYIKKVSNLLTQNGVREKPLSTTDENGEKMTLNIF